MPPHIPSSVLQKFSAHSVMVEGHPGSLGTNRVGLWSAGLWGPICFHSGTLKDPVLNIYYYFNSGHQSPAPPHPRARILRGKGWVLYGVVRNFCSGDAVFRDQVSAENGTDCWNARNAPSFQKFIGFGHVHAWHIRVWWKRTQ